MKEYRKPFLEVEHFRADEYVAACGDSGIVYKFTCDAGGGVLGVVYQETNGVDGLQMHSFWPIYEKDKELGGYHACGITHEASTTDAFLDGYYVAGGTVTPVKIWRGPDGRNIHCTTALDPSEWETAKS